VLFRLLEFFCWWGFV